MPLPLPLLPHLPLLLDLPRMQLASASLLPTCLRLGSLLCIVLHKEMLPLLRGQQQPPLLPLLLHDAGLHRQCTADSRVSSVALE